MLLLVFPSFSQESEPLVFRAGVSLVKVDTLVTGRDGRTIQGLQKQDFRILDEGAEQSIAYFETDKAPLDVLLLIDVSGSMRRSVEEMAKASRAALGSLLPQDRVAVMLFARRTDVRQEFTASAGDVEQTLRDAFRENSLGSGTLINPSLLAAADFMGRQQPRGRRAVVILTDNQGLNYQSPDQDVIRSFLTADTVLNGIVVRGGKRPEDDPAANPDFTPANVFAIAEQTGGEAMPANKAGKAFQAMMERIRARYSIQYAPPAAAPSGSFRRIRVELSAGARKRLPDIRISARSGYYVP
jgi:VWFA-related protein